MSECDDALKDRWFGLGFLAALAAMDKEPERLDAARKNAERMVAHGRRVLLAEKDPAP